MIKETVMHPMVLIAAMLAAPVVAAAGQVPDQSETPAAHAAACENAANIRAGTGKSFGIRPLDQEPDARQLLAVVRTIDGCNRPIAVRERVGFQRR